MDIRDTAPPFITQASGTVCWQSDYLWNDERLRRLYSRAKSQQWDADVELDWDTPIDPSRPIATPPDTRLDELPIFRRLKPSAVEAFRAHYWSYLLSQTLHGEQAALMTASILAHSVPDHQGKQYAATQVMDEARHVEMFERYARKLARIYPVSAPQQILLDRVLGADSWIKVALGMNMIFEASATGSFHNILRHANCPLLSSVVKGALRDESRHLAFGVLYLRGAIQSLDEAEREDVADFTFDIVQLTLSRSRAGVDPVFLGVLDAAGIELDDFLLSIAEVLDREPDPAIEAPMANTGVALNLDVRTMEHLTMPALVRVGAITRRTRELYRKAGVTIVDNDAVLVEIGELAWPKDDDDSGSLSDGARDEG